jgi:hypothetical protein
MKRLLLIFLIITPIYSHGQKHNLTLDELLHFTKISIGEINNTVSQKGWIFISAKLNSNSEISLSWSKGDNTNLIVTQGIDNNQVTLTSSKEENYLRIKKTLDKKEIKVPGSYVKPNSTIEIYGNKYYTIKTVNASIERNGVEYCTYGIQISIN